MAKYDPLSIGKRIESLIKERDITLSELCRIIQSNKKPPFGNVRKYIYDKHVKMYDAGCEVPEELWIGLGQFFLYYAVDAGMIAITLKTNIKWLTSGEGNKDKTSGTTICFEDISSRIKKCRKLQSKTIMDVLEDAKVSVGTYCGYENAKPDRPQLFSIPLLFDICDIISADPDYIMVGNEPHKADLADFEITKKTANTANGKGLLDNAEKAIIIIRVLQKYFINKKEIAKTVAQECGWPEENAMSLVLCLTNGNDLVISA